MKELYTTEFGSRLYGTSTPTSDTDLKTVFLPPLEKLLLGKGVKNIAQSTGSDHHKNSANDIDHEYIPLQVLAKDFVAGQTYAVELVFSVLNPTHEAKTIHDPDFVQFCEELSTKFLTSNVKAMIGYAMGQTHKYGVKGTRLASVRKFRAVLSEAFKFMFDIELITLSVTPPNAERIKAMRLSELWLPGSPGYMRLVGRVTAESDKYILNTTYEGPNDTRPPCISVIEKLFPLEITLAEAMKRADNMLDAYGSRASEAENNNGVDWKAVSHAMRICYEVIDVLESHHLSFPFDTERVQLLLSIKRGELPWLEVSDMLSVVMDNVDVAKEQCTLPTTEEVLASGFEAWLVGWLNKYYKTEGLN